MRVFHINTKNDSHELEKMNQMTDNGSQVFVLVYMDGCGPCNATRPEWAKLESALKSRYSKNEDLVIADINKDFAGQIKHIGSIDGFPTMKCISDNGKRVETYENSGIKKKDRSVDSFINWIENTMNNVESTTPTSSPHAVYERLTQTKSKKSKTKPNKSKSKLRRDRKNRSRVTYRRRK